MAAFFLTVLFTLYLSDVRMMVFREGWVGVSAVITMSLRRKRVFDYIRIHDSWNNLGIVRLVNIPEI